MSDADLRRVGMKPEFTVSSGNVFADLGLPNPEELLLKARLCHRISRIVRDLHFKKAQAACWLGVDVATLRDVEAGRLGKFSVEQLQSFQASIALIQAKAILPTTFKSF